MSTVHTAATRFVSYSLIPAALALSAAVAWGMQPPRITSPGTLRTSDVALMAVAALPQPQVAVTVAPDVIAVPKPSAVPKLSVPKPAPISKAAVPKPAEVPKATPDDPTKGLKRYCDDRVLSGSTNDKVKICTWR